MKIRSDQFKPSENEGEIGNGPDWSEVHKIIKPGISALIFPAFKRFECMFLNNTAPEPKTGQSGPEKPAGKATPPPLTDKEL